MEHGIAGLGVIILLAASLAVVARLLRQPTVLAYLATGVILGQGAFLSLSDRTSLQTFADLGIMLLLFLVGLEVNYSALRLVGKSAVILGLGQVVLTAGAGIIASLALGFPGVQSIYIGIALTFSSTVIVVKLLSEKKDLNSLYGKLSLGILLVQDFVAIMALVLLSGIKPGEEIVWNVAFYTLLKGISLFAFMVWFGRKIVPLIFDRIARSHELLFIVSIAWVFLVASVVEKLGFSIEIAGFLAGIALANSLESFEIMNKIRPLRDFFVLIFFVMLGLSVSSVSLAGLEWSIVLLSLFVLIGNPLIVMVIMGLMGYRKRTSFMTGVSIAQVSEFSLVLVALGLKLEHVNSTIVSLVTSVGMVTVVSSSYLIMYAEHVFKRLARILSAFERKVISIEDGYADKDLARAVVLVGAHRTGMSILGNLPKEHVLVVDFDPEIIERMKAQGYEYLFADSRDMESLERASLHRAMLVISTAPDVEDNLALIRYVHSFADRPKIIVRAEETKEAKVLYEAGADYVLFPHLTAGQYLGKTISADPHIRLLEHLKRTDMELLNRLTS